MKAKTGDKVVVKINGRDIETVIDPDGTQRLPCNRALAWLSHGKLCEMSTYLDRNKFSMEEVRWIYQNIGYSVSGYAEIFEKDEIENPLWKKGK